MRPFDGHVKENCVNIDNNMLRSYEDRSQR